LIWEREYIPPWKKVLVFIHKAKLLISLIREALSLSNAQLKVKSLRGTRSSVCVSCTFDIVENHLSACAHVRVVLSISA